MSKSFYITTPIYYINGKPSIGHAYTTIVADALARYHRTRGEEVFFLTGTDENSQKNLEAAEKAGKGDDVKGYLNEMAALWERTFDGLGIRFDRFIRTTESDHAKAVEKFWKTVEKTGDIYEGEYEGLYCKGCEAFVNESDLTPDGMCPMHLKKPDHIKEKNYFFKLTAYREKLLAHIEAHPEFIQPNTRRNEIVSYIRDFMSDVSISRSSVATGLPVPGDDSQRIYVWFDALINYLTGIGYGVDEDKFKKFWPANLHLVGKDILKFHCALWPAMLMSAGIDLPKAVFAHGFFTIDGQKMSKSLGNIIDPVMVAQDYGNDALRYYLLRDIRLGEDGDFSFKRLESRYQTELGNELGNLNHRVLSMTEKYFGGLVPNKVDFSVSDKWATYEEALENVAPHDALDAVWSLIRESNQRIENTKPWALAKEGKTEELSNVMYILLESLRHIAWMLLPLLPDTAEKMFEQLGLDIGSELARSAMDAKEWGGLGKGQVIKKGDPLFPRREFVTE